MLAGDSSFGVDSMEIMLKRMVSTCSKGRKHKAGEATDFSVRIFSIHLGQFAVQNLHGSCLFSHVATLP